MNASHRKFRLEEMHTLDFSFYAFSYFFLSPTLALSMWNAHSDWQERENQRQTSAWDKQGLLNEITRV